MLENNMGEKCSANVTEKMKKKSQKHQRNKVQDGVH